MGLSDRRRQLQDCIVEKWPVLVEVGVKLPASASIRLRCATPSTPWDREQLMPPTTTGDCVTEWYLVWTGRHNLALIPGFWHEEGREGKRREIPMVHRMEDLPSFSGGVAKAIPSIATDVICPCVCVHVCRLSHSCTLLKPLDGMRCHLSRTLVWSQVTLY